MISQEYKFLRISHHKWFIILTLHNFVLNEPRITIFIFFTLCCHLNRQGKQRNRKRMPLGIFTCFFSKLPQCFTSFTTYVHDKRLHITIIYQYTGKNLIEFLSLSIHTRRIKTSTHRQYMSYYFLILSLCWFIEKCSIF